MVSFGINPSTFRGSEPAFPGGYVRTAAATLHYYRAGGAGRPVLMLHGVTDNALCWSRTARALASANDCVLLDARGHGASSAPGCGYTAEHHADDVAAVVRELDLNKPVLLGHSMGAATAAATAARYPDHFGALILEDPPWRGEPLDDPVLMTERAARWRLALEKRRAQPLHTILDWGRKHFPAWTGEDLQQWAEAKQQTHPNVAGGIAGHGIRWQSVANDVRCPTLVIAGDPARGAIVTPAEALETRRLIAGARVIHIGGAGHNIRREQFDVFISVVRRFLAELG